MHYSIISLGFGVEGQGHGESARQPAGTFPPRLLGYGRCLSGPVLWKHSSQPLKVRKSNLLSLRRSSSLVAWMGDRGVPGMTPDLYRKGDTKPRERHSGKCLRTWCTALSQGRPLLVAKKATGENPTKSQFYGERHVEGKLTRRLVAYTLTSLKV